MARGSLGFALASLADSRARSNGRDWDLLRAWHPPYVDQQIAKTATHYVMQFQVARVLEMLAVRKTPKIQKREPKPRAKKE